MNKCRFINQFWAMFVKHDVKAGRESLNWKLEVERLTYALPSHDISTLICL